MAGTSSRQFDHGKTVNCRGQLADGKNESTRIAVDMTAKSFLCLCPPKKIESDGSSRGRRPENAGEVRAPLEALDFGGKMKTIVCLPGGGIAVEGTGSRPEVVVVGPIMAVLSGAIQNYAYLVRKYLLGELGLPKSASLEAIRQSSPVSDATLLCKLYQQMGTGMLAKLRGRFGFCLYDSTTVKVLAARDPTGAVGLVQGQTKEGALFIASGSVRPEGALNVVDIQPGKYKYGWHAAPRKFATPLVAMENRAAVATDAAAAALAGIAVKEKRPPPAVDWREEPDRGSPDRSLESCPSSGELCSGRDSSGQMERRKLSIAPPLQAVQNCHEDLSVGWGRARDVAPEWCGDSTAEQRGHRLARSIVKFYDALAAAVGVDRDPEGIGTAAGLGTQAATKAPHSRDGSVADSNASDQSSLTGFSVSDEGERVESPLRYTPESGDGSMPELLTFNGGDCSATTCFSPKGLLSGGGVMGLRSTLRGPSAHGESSCPKVRWSFV